MNLGEIAVFYAMCICRECENSSKTLEYFHPGVKTDSTNVHIDTAKNTVISSDVEILRKGTVFA